MTYVAMQMRVDQCSFLCMTQGQRQCAIQIEGMLQYPLIHALSLCKCYGLVALQASMQSPTEKFQHANDQVTLN